jgi:hypothetical protein
VTNKSVVPVSQRATTRLIRQLDLVRKGENITKSTMKEYEALFKGPKTNPPLLHYHPMTLTKQPKDD